MDKQILSINDIHVPELKLKPHYYQDYGIRYMLSKMSEYGFVLNADDVGLGKTLQAIGSIKWYIENKSVKHVLIICKKSIKSQWVSEIKKFTDLSDTFFISTVGGDTGERRQIYKSAMENTNFILVLNYHTFLYDMDIIKSLDTDMTIIDEVHSIKAREGVMNNNISEIAIGKPTIYLTGTPIMSSPEDVFGILQISNPEYLGIWEEFSKYHLIMEHGKRGDYVNGYDHIKELRNKIQNILIRRTENEVKLELPKTIYHEVECTMDKTQVEILFMVGKIRRNIRKEVDKLKQRETLTQEERQTLVRGENILKALIAADQILCSDPRVFLKSDSLLMKNILGKNVSEDTPISNKGEQLLNLVEDIVEARHKVIIFSKLKQCAKLIADDIESQLNYNVLCYTGDEKEQVRNDNVELFKTNPDYPILIGTEAMAEGLNLQVAKYVINYDQPDSSAIKTQRIGRVRRDGSEHASIIVYDLITKLGDTVQDDSESVSTMSKDEERLANVKATQNLTDTLVTLTDMQRRELISAMEGNPVASSNSIFETTTEDRIILRERIKKEKLNPTREYRVTITKSNDTRDDSDIWLVKVLDKLEKDEYISTVSYMNSIDGFYSKTRYAFVFKYDPKEILISDCATIEEAKVDDLKQDKIKLGQYNVIVKEDIDTRNNDKIYTVKITDRLDKSEYIKAERYMKSIGGYYSKFKKTFVFKNNPLSE